MASSSDGMVTPAKPTSNNVLFMIRIFGRKRVSRPAGQLKEQSVTPWGSWELDKKFLKDLSTWTDKNPEKPLDRILDRISDSLENNKDFLQLIPDSPFPARGLVFALAHLLKLGVMISHAQRDVKEFATGVIRWVELVKLAFETPGDGRFTRQTWRNLQETRDLIDEVCSWAAKRLKDKKWSQIGKAQQIHKEIEEFKERIKDAQTLFQNRSSVIQAKGLDVVVQYITYLFAREELVLNKVREIRKAQEIFNNQFRGESELRRQADERKRFLDENLNKHTVEKTTYNYQKKRPCDHDTRSEVLADIKKWSTNFSLGTPNFLWLTGVPGCGKSAVTASFAQYCKDQGTLWAQLFINRLEKETTDPTLYFPSIARQLATYSTKIAEIIYHTLIDQPSLLDDITDDQASKLFINSLREASQIDRDRAVIILIDGLDETIHDRLEDTTKVFSGLFASLETCQNVKVLISSRTESEIQNHFGIPSNDKRIERIDLSTSDPSSIRDVSRYIKRSLEDLVQKYQLVWDEWPGNQRAEALAQKASGLFIWGVTAIKYIKQRVNSDGKECLGDVLDMLTANVLSDVNALYALILEMIHGNSPSEWELERFRRIIGAIISLQEPVCINDLELLLDLRGGQSSSPVDMVHFVRRFRTILVAGTDSIDGNTIPRIHESVSEFLTNSVDFKFRVNSDLAHLELGIQCLNCLGTARESVARNLLPMPFRYASRFWSSHFSQARMLDLSIVCADYRHAPTQRLSLDSTSLFHKPIRIRYSDPTSEITTEVEWPEIWDAIGGTPLVRVQQYHHGIVTSIMFSPGGNDIVSSSFDETIKIRSVSNGQSIKTLVEHPNGFTAMAFSSHGNSVVSGSKDGSIHLWDYRTGEAIGKPFQEHKKGVTCVAFSSDGEKVVSGSDDKMCILWDVRTRRAVGQPWAGHRSRLHSVAFSTTGRRVCSMDDKGYCITWDVSNGEKISNWKYSGTPRCLSFLPEDDDVIAVGGEDGIKFRAHNLEWSIPGVSGTRCLSFSPSGKEIIYSTRSTIAVAEISNDKLNARVIKEGGFPPASRIVSAAFSPDFDRFVYADDLHAIHIFTLHHDTASLRVVPSHLETTAAGQSTNGIDQKLKDTLSNVKKAQYIHDMIEKARANGRLREITWYGSDLGGGTESGAKACIVKDDAVIAGYKDGSVLVHDQLGVRGGRT